MKVRVKQLISVLTVCLLLLAILPVSAFAANFNVSGSSCPVEGTMISGGDTLTNSNDAVLAVNYRLSNGSIVIENIAAGSTYTVKPLESVFPDASQAEKDSFVSWRVTNVFMEEGTVLAIEISPAYSFFTMTDPADVTVVRGNPAAFSVSTTATSLASTLDLSWYYLRDTSPALQDATPAADLQQMNLTAGWTEENGVWSSQNCDPTNSFHSPFDNTAVTLSTEEFTFSGSGGIVSFDARLSAEDGYDQLSIVFHKVGDDKPSATITIYTSTDTFRHFEQYLAPGSYTISFTYRKDMSLSRGDDRAYVKNLQLADLISSNSNTLTVTPEMGSDIYKDGARFFAHVIACTPERVILDEKSSAVATLHLIDRFTVTYNTNSGETIPTGYYTARTLPFTLAAPAAPDGCPFAGWFDNSEFTGSPVTQIAAGATGDKAFWAKWTTNASESVYCNAENGLSRRKIGLHNYSCRTFAAVEFFSCE